MAQTIYAAFQDASQAESAAGALLDHGVPADDISLLVSEEYHKRRGTVNDPELQFTQPTIAAGGNGDGLSRGIDPMHDNLRQSTGPLNFGGSLGATHETMKSDLSPDNSDLDLNPALDDYPRTGSASTTELSSRPPDSKYDFNPDLDTKTYNKNYDLPHDNEKVDQENRREFERDQTRTSPTNFSPESDEGLAVNRPDDATTARENDRTIGAPVYEPEKAAKHGVTTTTIQDAASGAAKGVGFGLGVGALAAIASLAIPGYGLVIGGGALATAIAGIAASAGAGAVAGGVVGYLKDQGVPATEIPKYKEAYDNGGAILTVHLESKVPQSEIEDVLKKYGATALNNYGYAA